MFINISEYSETELLNQPHSILRHSEMPASIFKFLWTKIKRKEEIFAYVVNKTKYDNHYWVMAHITPSLNDDEQIIGYHSVRRKPTQKALDAIKPLYRQLLVAEKMGGIQAGEKVLETFLIQQKGEYDEFILSL